MPQLGETVSEGTVTRWLRRQGETVTADEPLLEIQTDKVSMEVPSLRAGVLVEILVAEGQTVPVGAALAWLETDGADRDPAPVAEPGERAAVEVHTTPAAPIASDGGFAHARRPTPLIRRLLAEAGLTEADVTGTGPGGRVTRTDVAAALAARPSAPAAAGATPATTAAQPPPTVPPDAGGHTEPLTPLRRVIAARMVESLRKSAQLTSVLEVDVTRIADLRRRANQSAALTGTRLSFLPFFARAAVEALQSHPNINARVDTEQGTVTRFDPVHLAIAVDTDAGLLAPVIRDAGRLSIVGLALGIAEVAARARSGAVNPDELTGGTFTITNTGSRGALFDTPIINQPQVAILATGAVVRRPVVVHDGADGSEGIAIRSMVYLALTYDHRLIDGAAAAGFLVAIRERLEGGGFEQDLGLRAP
jgi:2-oxoglutarate dehydrogenase E2 component (dihydrolipoamide succinyltransferase)